MNEIATAQTCQTQPTLDLKWFGSPTPVEDAIRYLRRAWLDVYDAQTILENEWKNPVIHSALQSLRVADERLRFVLRNYFGEQWLQEKKK